MSTVATEAVPETVPATTETTGTPATEATGKTLATSAPNDENQSKQTTAETGEKKEGTTETGQPEGTKDGEVAPLQITLPEGLVLDETLATELQGLQAKGLTQELANDLIQIHAKALEAAFSKGQEVVESWRGAALSDKELGGDKLPETQMLVGKALTQFGTPGLREMLDLTGVGNHPEFLRFARAVGAKLREGTAIATGAPAGQTQIPLEDRVYTHPTSKPTTETKE